MNQSLDPVSEELALILERYLERDLESLITQIGIPILNIDQVIVDRVQGTSPRELELAIQGIVRSELQAIVNLGGILGFAIGCLQATFFFTCNELDREKDMALFKAAMPPPKSPGCGCFQAVGRGFRPAWFAGQGLMQNVWLPWQSLLS